MRLGQKEFVLREFNKEAQTPEIAHLIGFDFYRYGWDMGRNNDLQQLNPDQLKPIHDGYKEAEHAKHRKINTNYFQRKLLQIRARAYRKGVEVSITESDIEQAYHFTNEVCPAIQKPLSMGTGEDTDFSVDRVDNEKGYVPGNIFVMSSYANQAKDDISLEELMLYVTNKDKDMYDYQRFSKFEAMSPPEWIRLYFWIAGFMSDELVGRTSYRVVHENRQISFLTDTFHSALYLTFSASTNKDFDRQLEKWRVLKPYIGREMLNDRQKTRLRKVAKKTARQNGLNPLSSSDFINIVDTFLRTESIQDILDIIDDQLVSDIYSKEGTRRTALVKELYHRRYRESVSS